MKTEIITFKNLDYDLELDFSIAGYEFPDAKSELDANWLIVGLECRYQNKIFATKDPSIEVGELDDIWKWFHSISFDTIPAYTNLSFLEPNLEFQLFRKDKGAIRFGIKLDAESKPPFLIRELAVEEVDFDDIFTAVFESSFQELRTIADSFQNLLATFPFREERPSN